MAAFDDEVLHLGTAPDENQLRTIEAIEDFLQDDYLFDSDAGEDIDFEEDSDDEEEELRPPPATVEAAPSSGRAGLSVSQVRRKMVFLGSHAELKEEIKSMIAALENPSQAAAASSSSSGFDLKPDTAELDSWKMLLAQIDNNAALSGLSDGGQPSSSAPVLDQLAPMRASLRASSTVAKAALPPLDDEVKQLLSRQRARTRLARSSVTLRQNDGEQQKKLGRRALVSSAPHTAPDRHERNIDSAPEQHNPEADRAPAADGAAEPDYVDRWCNFCYEMSEPDPSLKGSTCDCLDLSTQLCRSCVIVCLERYLDTGSRFLPSNCPICATHIDVEEFAERLLTPENFARFQHHRMLLLLRTNSSYTRCRDPRCEKVIKVGELVCSHCQAQFCPDCDLLAHPDQTCAQYRRQLRRVRPRATFGSVVRNAASKLSVKMRTTACAKCGVRVQKNGGWYVFPVAHSFVLATNARAQQAHDLLKLPLRVVLEMPRRVEIRRWLRPLVLHARPRHRHANHRQTVEGHRVRSAFFVVHAHRSLTHYPALLSSVLPSSSLAALSLSSSPLLVLLSTCFCDKSSSFFLSFFFSFFSFIF